MDISKFNDTPARPLLPSELTQLYAKQLAECGLLVLPCNSDKSPRLPRGFHDASTDLEIIEQWNWGNNALVGIVPASAGYIVFDCDHEPQNATAWLQDRFGEPVAVTTSRRKGGLHTWYKCNDANEMGNGQWEFGDIRGAKGYVIAWDPTVLWEQLEHDCGDTITTAEVYRHTKKNSKAEDGNPDTNTAGLNGDIWPEGTRNNKCYAALQKALKNQMGLDQVINTAQRSGLPSDEILQILKSASKSRIVHGEEGKPLEFITMEQLLNAPEEDHRWLVDDRLLAGGLSMLAAKPKAGKSTLVRCLALAVARGEPWLGCEVTQGSVFYLALEEAIAEIKRHFAMMGAKPDDPIYVYSNRLSGDAYDALEKAVNQLQPAFVIIDPLQRFIRVGDTSDYAAVTQAFDPLLHLARESGAHILVTHHNNKAGGSEGDEVLGSTALFGSVDCLLSMKRTDAYRTIYSRQRYGTDLPETVLTMDDSGKIHTGGVRNEVDKADTGRAILAFLAGQKTPVIENVIEKGVAGTTRLIRDSLRKLVSDGQVQRTGEGKKGSPYLYSTDWM